MRREHALSATERILCPVPEDDFIHDKGPLIASNGEIDLAYGFPGTTSKTGDSTSLTLHVRRRTRHLNYCCNPVTIMTTGARSTHYTQRSAVRRSPVDKITLAFLGESHTRSWPPF